MKYIIIVPDGMADEPLEILGDKTPLEAANVTNMDYLAQHGYSGQVKTIPEGMAPGSDIGNMALLGYNPRNCHKGRAPLEAASMGIVLKNNEIAFRCNLVTVEDEKMMDYSAGHITDKEADVLIKSLNDALGTPEIKFYPGKGYRHLLVLTVRDPKTFMAMKTTPPHDILGKKVAPHLPKGNESEMLLKLMEKSRDIFENHAINNVRIDLKENPANMIWLWGQGTHPNLAPFSDKFKVKGSIISAVDLVRGLGKLAGLEVIDVPGITGYYDTNYLGKAEYALKALEKNDFVYIHIEAPDEAGHNGDARAKIEAIERIDKDVIGTILNHYGQNDEVRILVVPDHPTPVALRTHTSEPVGFVMYGKGISQNGAEIFSERTSEEKGLLFESGEALINHFMKKFIQ